MLHYKQILVPTDLSKDSALLIEKAQDIGNISSAKITLIHVIEHASLAYGGEYSISLEPELESAIKDRAQQALERQVLQAGGALDSHICDGPVKTAVCDHANEIGADLILVGKHRHQGVEKLLGSRANAILHAAQCDVLVHYFSTQP